MHVCMYVMQDLPDKKEKAAKHNLCRQQAKRTNPSLAEYSEQKQLNDLAESVHDRTENGDSSQGLHQLTNQKEMNLKINDLLRLREDGKTHTSCHTSVHAHS